MLEWFFAWLRRVLGLFVSLDFDDWLEAFLFEEQVT
jgi:hypothetical protein